MSAVSVRLVLWHYRPRGDGTAPILVRITQARRSRYVKTGVYVLPKDWNDEKQEVRRSDRLYNKKREKLKASKLKAERAALEAQSAEAAIAALDKSSGTFSAYLTSYIDALEERGQYWEHRKFEVTERKLKAALGDEIAWSQLDRSALVRFERHLRDKCMNKPNTVRKELGRVRRVIRRAIRDGRLSASRDPFLNYDLPKSQPVKRRRLTLDEIDKVANLELPFGELHRTVRDLYLISFYAAGLRVSDALRLKPDDVKNGRVEYRMLKTAHLQSVKIPPRAQKILEPYVEAAAQRKRGYPYLFPLLKRGNDDDGVNLRKRIISATAIVNDTLKEIADKAEIGRDGFSSHTARHSFADHARKSGDLYAVSKALGHTKLATTQQYLSEFDRAAVDRLTDNLWGEDSTEQGD